MGEGGREEEKGSSALSLFRFHLSPFPQKRLILRLGREQKKGMKGEGEGREENPTFV